MIGLKLSKQEFENEFRSLLIAFYHGEKITMKYEEEAEEDLRFIIDANLGENEIGISFVKNEVPILAITKKADLLGNKSEYKNQLKIGLYEALSELTKKELPWGTMTGVRPTKQALARLEEGKSKEQVLDYFGNHYLCSKEKASLSYEIARRELDILEEIDYKNGYSIYIGIPFCPTRCLYCSFTAYSLKTYESYVDSYLETLFKEIEYAKHCFDASLGKKLTTIYVGGGTPTSLNEQQLERLLEKIKETFDFSTVKEYTVEAGRPDSITYEKLRLLKEYGVDRISINPQTMNQETLDIIGRHHTVEDIENTFKMARELGHENINMDLIVGLPGEDVKEVEHTIERLKALGPDSVTVHTLAIKRAAYLNMYKDKYQDLTFGDASAMLQVTSEYAKEAELVPYYLYRQKNMSDNLENVGYSTPGKECIYNILIMEEKQTIVALGAGASSKFVFPEEGRIERVENVKDVKEYVTRIDEMIDRKRNFIMKEYYGGRVEG